jgi:predicted RecA/RadA family phage recombinase
MESISSRIAKVSPSLTLAVTAQAKAMIAKGEVVMVGERFGIRFGEIVEPEKRMQSL